MIRLIEKVLVKVQKNLPSNQLDGLPQNVTHSYWSQKVAFENREVKEVFTPSPFFTFRCDRIPGNRLIGAYSTLVRLKWLNWGLSIHNWKDQQT